MAKVTVEGRIVHVGETEQVSDKFSKRIVVIEEEGKYPQEIAVELTQDNVSLADNLAVGDTATATGFLRGRGWQKDASTAKRWFLSINCIEIESQGVASVMTNDAPGGDDDLPF